MKITKIDAPGLKLIQDSEGWSSKPYPDPASGGFVVSNK
jgi:GH24 family phage-related lysozyme (muramidase)